MKSLTKIALVSLLFASVAAGAQPDGYVERGTRNFLKKLNAAGGKPIEEMSPQDARKTLVDLQKGAALPHAEVFEKTIHADSQQIKLTIVKPPRAKKPLPAFMFFHGGGWVLGDFPTHERFVRDLVVDSGAAAVFVNYTPSPEAQYPVAIHQAYAATKWVADHGKEIHVDGSRLAVVGNSVGGNMAAVVSLMAKEKGGPEIRLQVLFWPVTDANFETASYNEFSSGYFLTKNMMKWFWDNYAKDPNARKEIYASPLNASIEQLRGLPATLVQTAANDVLRDEGEAYARKLDTAGVSVVSTRYNGMIHDFGLLNALSAVPATRSALHQAAEAIKKALN